MSDLCDLQVTASICVKQDLEKLNFSCPINKLGFSLFRNNTTRRDTLNFIGQFSVNEQFVSIDFILFWNYQPLCKLQTVMILVLVSTNNRHLRGNKLMPNTESLACAGGIKAVCVSPLRPTNLISKLRPLEFNSMTTQTVYQFHEKITAFISVEG